MPKIQRLLLILGLLTCGLVRADIMFETLTKTDGLVGMMMPEIKSRSFFKSDRSRIETSAGDTTAGPFSMVIITRLDLKVIWTLNPATKTYQELKIEDLKSKEPSPVESLKVEPELSVEKTGNKKKILDQECEEVVAAMKIPTDDGSISLNQVIWLASDISGYKDLFEYGMKVRELGLAYGLLPQGVPDDHLKEFQEKVSNIYGFPMEWSLDMDMVGADMNFKMKTEYMVTNYACAPISSNVFDLPPGYVLQQ